MEGGDNCSNTSTSPEGLEGPLENINSTIRKLLIVQQDETSTSETTDPLLKSAEDTSASAIQDVPTMQQEESAVARTFAITELLENILAELPQRDILLAERISQTFNATINGSPLLRKLLFFEPPTDPLNDDSVQCFREDFIRDDDPNYTGPKHKAPQNKPIIWINTLLWKEPSLHKTELAMEREWRVSSRLPLVDGVVMRKHQKKRKRAAPYTYGSWRRMYIASAPLPLYIRGKVFESKGRTYYKDHGSMTIGELLACHPWDGEEKPLKRCWERMLE